MAIVPTGVSAATTRHQAMMVFLRRGDIAVRAVFSVDCGAFQTPGGDVAMFAPYHAVH